MTDNGMPLPGTTTINTVGDWETVFGSAMLDGIVAGRGNQLNPTLDSGGRNAVIDTGQCVIRGFGRPVTAPTPTAIPAASGQNRIDRLVMRLNRSAVTAGAFIQPVVITGTPSANPVAPAITQTQTGNWDLPICQWTSLSSGGLTGLLDERPIPIVAYSGVSTSRPNSPAGGVTMLYERDTGMVALNNGAGWSYIAQTPDTWHTITSFAASGWSGQFAYRFAAPGLVTVVVTVSLSGSASVADNTTICSLSTAYTPRTYKPLPMYTDALKVSPQSGSTFESAMLSVRSNGTVVCYGVGLAASIVSGSASYPTTI